MRISYLLFVLLSILSVKIRADYQYAQCVFPSGGKAQGNIQIVYLEDGSKLNFITSLNNIMQNDGDYALSIMKYGFNPTNATDLGGVFDASNTNTAIGCPSASGSAFRVGDLGNINVATGSNSITISQITMPSLLKTSINNIIGRSIAISTGKYDCTTPSNSNLGSVFASCVIGIGSVTTAPKTLVNTTAPNVNTAVGYSQIDSTQYDAMAVISATTASTSGNINGQVSFAVDDTTILITGQVTGTNNATHGFHIHASGDLGKNDGSSIDGHWFQDSQVHGLPETPNRHNGDLGNLCLYSDDWSTVYYKYSTNYFSFSGLVGRGFAVHIARDDGTNVGGARIAQGVVALIPKASSKVSVPSTWKYEVTCPNGPLKGSSTAETTTTTTTTTTSASTTTGEPGTSSFLTPFISLIVFTIISTLFIL